MTLLRKSQERRRMRIRSKLRRISGTRLRLTVYRSNCNIYAQIIDDESSVTLTSASTLDKKFRDITQSGTNKDAARKVGELVAERAVSLGITNVYFDRSGYLYHGRIRALAEAAREKGLNF